MGFLFMADFTTWAAMHTAIKNQIANRDMMVRQYRSPDGTLVEFRSFDELLAIEAAVASKAAAESATSGAASRRAYATCQGESW